MKKTLFILFIFTSVLSAANQLEKNSGGESTKFDDEVETQPWQDPEDKSGGDDKKSKQKLPRRNAIHDGKGNVNK